MLVTHEGKLFTGLTKQYVKRGIQYNETRKQTKVREARETDRNLHLVECISWIFSSLDTQSSINMSFLHSSCKEDSHCRNVGE